MLLLSSKKLIKDIKCILFYVEYNFIAEQWATGVEDLQEEGQIS